MLIYLVQMIACSGILYGYYHFFLRNEKFHQYNRFYLLFAVVVSIVLPLFKIPVELSQPDNSPIYVFVSTGENIVVTAKQSFNWLHVIYMGYTLLAFVFVVKLILALLKIQRIKKDADTEQFPEFKFIKTAHEDAPFSFFNWLFWNQKNRIDSSEGRHIFKHELYHIRNKHSWDLLFIEIILCILWFNPFYYLYRKEIKTIQEFLADKHATENTDINEYARLLVFQAAGIHTQKLINPFFHNQLKRRIAMLLSSKKPQHQWLRKLLVLPVAVVVITLFAFSYKKEIKNILPNISANSHHRFPKNEVQNVNSKFSQNYFASDTLPSKNKKANEEKRTNEVNAYYYTGSGRYRKLDPITVIGYLQTEPQKMVLEKGETKIDVDAKYPGNWNDFLMRNINAQIPTDKGAPAGNYQALIRFTVNEDGSLSDFEAVTNEGFGMEDEVIRVLKKSEKWYPAMNNKSGGSAKHVKSYRLQPVNFQVFSKNAASGTADATDNKKEPEIFTKVEVDAKYPGNWPNFLVRNLDPQVAVDKGASVGNHTVIVQFVVDRDGHTSDFKALTNEGHGMEEEALRVIKKSGLWTPAVQNGRAVKAYKKQPITFVVEEVKNEKVDS